VAAEDNSWGTIGVAPDATIIGVKVLHDGIGYFSWLIQGIMYVADEADADIINMSMGAVYPRNSWSAAKLNSALGRAMNYAYQAGVTIVASAGNDAIDFDHAGPWVKMPAEAQHVITVSATAPEGFAWGATDFDKPASYTNYGQSLVDFAAPGGDYDFPGNYWWYDMVLSPCYVEGIWHYWGFAAGTSQAAPHVAGVAALIIEKYGYQDATGFSMKPAHVEAMLRKSADDLGKPGNDDFYGLGRVNAYRAVN
jgi:subtilisin family serine protease